MGKKQGKPHTGGVNVQGVQAIAQKLADGQGLELVEVAMQKESRGKCLCVFLDKEGGLTLDDCEKYHKLLQPLIEDVEYDFLEVSSPGIDRPIKTQRDFEKNRGAQVEVKLFAPVDGAKLHQGALYTMDDESVTIRLADESEKSFPRKAVALIKPVIELNFDEDEDV